MRLLQLSDSALPIGTFSFSNTLESAVEWGVVGDRESLQEYCSELLRVVALTDGVAALHALNACNRARYDDILRQSNHFVGYDVLYVGSKYIFSLLT